MPKNKVSDPITDQEMALGRLVVSGTMTDRQAAEALGLNPDTAAYTKAKPRVRDYMLEYRAALQQQLFDQDAEERRRFNLSRDRVLARLWQIADLDPAMTRGSASSQMKALSMIVAIEGLIPDRRAVSPNKPAPQPANPPFYVSEWMRTRQDAQSADPQPPAQEEPAPEPQSAPPVDDDPLHPVSDPTPNPTSNLNELSSRPERSEMEGPAVHAPLNPSQRTSLLPRVPMADYVAPDTRRPFSIDKNRFGRRR